MKNHGSPPVPAPLGRRERKKQETRRRIYSAAFELFLQKGYDETTVEEIAERADVGKGTVFNYFPQKTSFLAALSEDWVSRLFEEFGPVDEWRGTTRKKLERVFLFLADLAVENPELSRQAFFESLRHLYSPKQDGCIAKEESVREFQEMTRSVLRQGQQAGEVRSDVEPDHAATLIEAAFHRTLLQWLRDEGSTAGVHAEISAKLDIVFDGVAPRNDTHSRADKHAKKCKGNTRKS